MFAKSNILSSNTFPRSLDDIGKITIKVKRVKKVKRYIFRIMTDSQEMLDSH